MSSSGIEVLVVHQFAVPLPLTVIADALGVSRDDMPTFKRWSDDAVAPIGGMIGPERELECARSGLEFQRYFANELDQRRDHPRDDILTDLLNARLEGERPLDTGEMLNMLQQILVAGNETTTSLIASALLLLLQHPGHLDALRADLALIPNFVEEALRFESPVQGLSRVAKIDAQVGGVPIPAGAQLVLMYGSANRDERHFAHPEKFEIDRENARVHFAFGGGIHYCLGAPTPIYKLSPPPKARTERNLQNSRLTSPRAVLRWTWGARFRPNARFSRKEEENPEN